MNIFHVVYKFVLSQKSLVIHDMYVSAPYVTWSLSFRCKHIQRCVSQTQQTIITVLGQHVSILIESSSGPSKTRDPYLEMFKCTVRSQTLTFLIKLCIKCMCHCVL